MYTEKENILWLGELISAWYRASSPSPVSREIAEKIYSIYYPKDVAIQPIEVEFILAIEDDEQKESILMERLATAYEMRVNNRRLDVYQTSVPQVEEFVWDCMEGLPGYVDRHRDDLATALVLKSRIYYCLQGEPAQCFLQECPIIPKTSEDVVEGLYKIYGKQRELGLHIYHRVMPLMTPDESYTYKHSNRHKVSEEKYIMYQHPRLKKLKKKCDDPFTYSWMFQLGPERFAHLYSKADALLALPVITIDDVCNIHDKFPIHPEPWVFDEQLDESATEDRRNPTTSKRRKSRQGRGKRRKRQRD